MASSVNTDDQNPSPSDRWERGFDHDPRSEEIVRALDDLDWKFYDGHLDIRFGGDGDNGESMMYLLDWWFAERDAGRSGS